jgi:tRNA pseudouridine55 synthase
VDDRQGRLLLNGAQITMPRRFTAEEGPVAAFGPEDRFLALVEPRGGRAKSLAVFARNE